jgi:AcrR family transcriptional regulator
MYSILIPFKVRRSIAVNKPVSRRTKVALKAAPKAVAVASPPVAPPSADAGGQEPRGARRKRETREKLMEAAFRLMAERGMDAVAINEITEAADVGFGSFYNHFESKDAIYAAVMDEVFEEFADALEHLVAGLEDPAEIISVCVRHTILRARRESLWGKFLLREGLSARALTRGLGVRLMRDIQRGITSGRFKVSDPAITFLAMGSSVLGAIAVEVNFSGGAHPLLSQFGFDAREMPERTAAILLHTLGIRSDQAQRISHKPLPVVE